LIRHVVKTVSDKRISLGTAFEWRDITVGGGKKTI